MIRRAGLLVVLVCLAVSAVQCRRKSPWADVGKPKANPIEDARKALTRLVESVQAGDVEQIKSGITREYLRKLDDPARIDLILDLLLYVEAGMAKGEQLAPDKVRFFAEIIGPEGRADLAIRIHITMMIENRAWKLDGWDPVK